jgi:hypothetical protein
VVSTPLKNMKNMIIPNIWKNKKCFKPPTRTLKTILKMPRYEP